jgi:hypothetical protein
MQHQSHMITQMSAYTLHLTKSLIAFLESHPAVLADPNASIYVSHLRENTIPYVELGEITKAAETAGDPRLVEAALDMSITIASAGRWKTWSALRASGHNPAFDRNFVFQDFMARHWNR